MRGRDKTDRGGRDAAQRPHTIIQIDPSVCADLHKSRRPFWKNKNNTALTKTHTHARTHTAKLHLLNRRSQGRQVYDRMRAWRKTETLKGKICIPLRAESTYCYLGLINSEFYWNSCQDRLDAEQSKIILNKATGFKVIHFLFPRVNPCLKHLFSVKALLLPPLINSHANKALNSAELEDSVMEWEGRKW